MPLLLFKKVRSNVQGTMQAAQKVENRYNRTIQIRVLAEKGNKMGYKIGIDKKQISFMPMCLDDIIEENHICRVISAFT